MFPAKRTAASRAWLGLRAGGDGGAAWGRETGRMEEAEGEGEKEAMVGRGWHCDRVQSPGRGDQGSSRSSASS